MENNKTIIRKELDSPAAFDIFEDAAPLFEGEQQNQENYQDEEEIEQPPILENEEPEAEEPETETEGVEETEDEPAGEAPQETEEDNNPKVLAEYWKSIGKLPEDFDPDTVTSYDDLDTVYRENREKELQEEIETRLLQKFEDEGYSKEILEYAKLIRQGANPETLKESVILQSIATAQIDPDTEQGRLDAEQVIRMYYADKGFKEAKINKMVQEEFDDEESYKETLVEAQAHFGEKGKQIEQEEAKAAKKAEEQKLKSREDLKKSWNSWLDRGEIAGAKYSKEEMETVRRAIYEPTEVVQNANGKRERVTLMEKKRRELQQDKEKGFRNIVEFVLGYSKEDLKEEAKKEVNNEILKRLDSNKIIGTSRATSKQKVVPKNTAPISRRELQF